VRQHKFPMYPPSWAFFEVNLGASDTGILCDPCARLCPCVLCAPCVSRLPPVSFYRYSYRYSRGESVDAAIHLLPLGGEADPLRSRLGRVPGLSCVELCGLLGHSQLSDEVTSPCAIEPLHCLFKLDAVASFLTPARPTRHRC
jgi:hypothetical protein